MTAPHTALAALALAAALSLPLVAQPPATPQLATQVPVPPSVVRMDGGQWLVYELHIANHGATAATLTGVEISGTTTSATPTSLARFAGDALARRLDAVATGTPARQLPAGGRRVVYIEVRLPEGDAPRHLRHDVRFSAAGVASSVTADVPGVSVDERPPPVLGAPLAAGPWVAVHHPDWERGHRRVFYPRNDGTTVLPGRFTIDFVKVDANGKTTRDNADLVANSLGYGADVLAVADAEVTVTRDTIDEVLRVSQRRKHAPDDAAGNYVSLSIGDQRFAVYEHLKPGSIRVKPGQQVKRGDVIAQLGFTGDSTGPHLHLHVSDAASPLGGEGRPFVFDRVEMLGAYPDIAQMDKAPWNRAGAGTRRDERPSPNAVVDFGPVRRWDERLPFVDDAARCEGFAEFRSTLMGIVARQDTTSLLRYLDPGIGLSFGGDHGLDDFRRMWLVEPEDRARLWRELHTVLSQGGRCESPDVFVAPYVHTHWPDALDPFDYGAVVADDAALRATPAADAAVRTRLSREIVKIADWASQGSPWVDVETSDGRRGFVDATQLHSAVGMRAWFTREHGVWRITTWIGGD